MAEPDFFIIPRAYYRDAVARFLEASCEEVLGHLTAHSDFSVEPAQRDAWMQSIVILKSSLAGLSGTLFLEFNIPRMGRRVDAILVSGPVVFSIEFKIGEESYTRDGLSQAWDYALDLKNFHLASHHVSIVPILVATSATASDHDLCSPHADGVYPPLKANSTSLRKLIDSALQQIVGGDIDASQWGASHYHPTPTIIEAAQALYSKHSVQDIARHDAGAINLRVTSQRIEELVEQARANKRKIICFVTGVPGAGKTLVGLNIATHRRDKDQPTHAVFLSGNGPLVAVLREALARDEVKRKQGRPEKIRKGEVLDKIKAFIQNVHHFRDEGLRDKGPPVDRVVIFDEAQRAWNAAKTEHFMRTRKKRAGFTQSEPEFLISYMDRHQDWAVIVCLVGGGQEINTGEAGISAWLDALTRTFPEWVICLSPHLSDTEYDAGHALEKLKARERVCLDDSLHLAVSMRSFRAENVSCFVKAILDCEEDRARETFAKLADRYPIALTRNLGRAKDWIRAHARGSERYGLVASSEAQRLKPHAVDIRVDIDPVHWFLNDSADTRSSYYLEDAATEFQVQGLELDWACVTWDGDLRFADRAWSHHAFRGKSWVRLHQKERQNYLKNAYRVLLTRARQGMVIFVPRGDESDPTRASAYYDPTYNYLLSVGIPSLD